MMSDAKHIASVRRLRRLDAAADEPCQRIARVAAQFCGVDAAAIVFADCDGSLVRELGGDAGWSGAAYGRFYFKALAGVAAEQATAILPLCRQVIGSERPLVIEDGGTLGAEGVGFYAGYPLRAPESGGIGVLCVFGRRPLELSQALRERLRDLASVVEDLLAANVLMQTQSALFEANPDAVYSLDRNGRFTSCNDAVLRLSGYRREEIIGRSFLMLIPREDQALLQQYFLRCLAGEPVYLQARLLARGGEERYGSISAFPYTVDGQIQGVVGITRDITAQVASERRLKESEERLRLALANSGQGVWEWDIASRRIYHSPESCALYGFPPRGCWETADHWSDRIHPDDRAKVMEETRRLFREQADDYGGESRIRCADGQYRWIRFHGKIVARREDGSPLRAIGVTSDIHEQKLAAQERRRQAERMALAVQAGGVGIFEADLDSGIVTCDARMYELLGLMPDGAPMTLERMYEVLYPGDRRQMRGLLPALLDGRISAVDEERRVVWPDGSIHHLRMLGKVFRFSPDGPRLLIGTCWDVTEARALQQQLSYQATHDALTGLYNRFEFERRLQAVQRGQTGGGRSHVLCFIDLDRFKIVNDTAGHAVGDALLYELGQALAREVRSTDVLARLGGDEFALLLLDCTVEQAEQIAHKLIDRIENLNFRWRGRSYDISASIGIARLSSDSSANVADVMAQADVACYAAKTGGRGRVSVYLSEHSDAQQHHRELIVASTIRDAVDTSRFRLFAQEIVACDPEGDCRRHVELLLRMADDKGGVIAPTAFIPAAERFGLMAQVDRWVLREALQQKASRLAAVPGLTVSINLSAQSLNDPTFLPFIEALLMNSPLEPARVRFEITETAAVTHLTAAGQVIERLRALGCGIALDDFGSGLSSFGYLKHFKVDYVKIDGGFVRELPNSASDRAIVRSIQALAREFGARTVAEYVEDETVFASVRELGVDYAQGYVFGRPRPLDELLREFAAACLGAG